MIDMRALGAVLLLLVTSFFAMTVPTMAQSSLRACSNVSLTGPADGAVLDDGYRTNFTWSAEPRGTASREWVSVRVDGDGNVSFDDAQHKKADPRLYKGFARGRPGIYAWAVIFYDAKGNPLCISPPRTYIIPGAGVASLSSDGSASGELAAAKAALGRYVVKLAGSSYAGSFNREVNADNYDDLVDGTGAFDWKAQGYTGLDLHGNDKANVLKGSNLGDNIWGYGGNDLIQGRGGNDTIRGGNEQCKAEGLVKGCTAGDAIDGGDGDDTIYGGDESCSAKGILVGCTAGDAISGGAGNDTIYGGDETCKASGLAGCTAGDAISGGSGKDTINGQGGNDAISGGADDDVINGGDGNDVLDGDGGNDTINGGNGNDGMNGGAGSDTLNGEAGFDIGNGGAGNDSCSASTEISISC